MREVQIYVKDPSDSEFKRIDLFKDETIELVQKIQDVRDIEKVFTDFTQNFEIPASASNNKIFKHVYNHNITGTNSFDPRIRYEARIYLNHLLFKRGRLFLAGTKMKNKKPHSYSVAFFGSLVQLKDILRDDKLFDLQTFDAANDPSEQLKNFNHTFGYTQVRDIFKGTGLTVNSDNKALIYPLITSKKRLFYSDTLSNTDSTNFDGNLYIPDTGNDIDRYHKRGVTEEDLKPAIRVKHIIAAIEKKYNINFIGGFLDDSNEAFEDLYLWLSNSSGNITGKNDDDKYPYGGAVSGYTYVSGDNLNHSWLSFDDDVIKITNLEVGQGKKNYWFEFDVTVDDDYDDIPWRLNMYYADGSKPIATAEGVGSKSIALYYDTTAGRKDGEIINEQLRLEFQSKRAMEDTVIRLESHQEFRGIALDPEDQNNYNSSQIDTNTLEIRINQHIPDIKIIDFIKGIFNMFNLTAIYIDDETDSDYSATTPQIRVVSLDDYYADAVNNQSNGTIDITKYVDVNAEEVNTVLPFSEVNLTFEESNTLLMKNHLDSFGEVFGDSKLVVQDLYRENNSYVLNYGEKYEIELPFAKLKYERILNGDTEETYIQWGYAAGGDFETKDADYTNASDIVPPKGDYTSESIEPLLFYGVRETITEANSKINFSDAAGTQTTAVANYYRPSNSVGTVDEYGVPPHSINFDAEIDEWHGVDSYNSLFNKYYRNYIRSVFDKTKRMRIVIAHFPPSFLIHYRLNDQLKIQDTVYRINSIRTNLATGKSKLELINLSNDEIV